MLGGLDRETLVDLTVNAMPLVIMGLSGLLFVVYNPWGRFGLPSLVQFGLLGVMGVVLTYVSWRSGLAISRTEGGHEE